MIIWFAANISKESKGGIKRSVTSLSHQLALHNNKTELIFNKTERVSYLIFSLRLSFKYLISIATFKTPDWIIGRSTDNFFTAILIKLLHKKTKIVLYSHGWEEFAIEVEKKLPSHIITTPTTWRSFLIRIPMLKATMWLSDIVVSGTVFENNRLKKIYPKISEKFKYLPNGIVIPAKKVAHNNSLNFLFIGNSSWKKNLDYAIQLFKKLLTISELSNAKLTCIGTGLTDLEFTDRFGKFNSIINKKEIAPDDMGKIYENNTILISTSLYEGGHEFAILEALSNSLLIFCTPINSSREIITDNQNGYIISGTSLEEDTKIVSKILNLNNDKIKNSAFNSVKKFSIDKVGESFMGLLCKKQ